MTEAKIISVVFYRDQLWDICCSWFMLTFYRLLFLISACLLQMILKFILRFIIWIIKIWPQIFVGVSQHDIDFAAFVEASWGLTMNPDKCAAIRFGARSEWTDVVPFDRYSLNGEHLSVVWSHRDLEILVDSTLRFHGHIRLVVSKSAAHCVGMLILWYLCLCLIYVLFWTLLLLYEYWLLGWSLAFGVCSLFSGDRWISNIIDLRELSYSVCLRTLNLYYIQGHLLHADMIKCCKIFHGECDISLSDLFVMTPICWNLWSQT